MEYLRQSAEDLVKNLMEMVASGLFGPNIEGLLSQAAGYITASEAHMEKFREELYLLEERMCIQLESEECEAAAKAEDEDKSGWYSDESPTPAP